MTKKNATPKNETDRRLVGIARRCRFSATPKTKPTAAGSELLVGVAAARSELLVGVAAKPPSHERLTCNYTQPRKQRVCFFKKARRAGFFYGPIAFFLRIFDEFFSGFRAKFQKIVTVSLFQPNLRKQIRNLPKILNFVKKIHYYCELFTSLFSHVT